MGGALGASDPTPPSQRPADAAPQEPGGRLDASPDDADPTDSGDTDDASDLTDAGVAEDVADAATSIDASVPLSLTNLELRYTTPLSAMLMWSSFGGESMDFARYEIWHGTDEASVMNALAPAVRWSDEEDPGLAFLERPIQQRITRTILSGLLPNTHYYARLRGLNTSGTVLAETGAISFDTPSPPTQVLTLYANAFLLGSWSGATDVASICSSTRNPYAGSRSSELESLGVEDGSVFHYGGLNLARPWSAGSFQTAFLEFAIDCPDTIEYVEAWISDPDGETARFVWPDYFVCHPGYQVIQVPLTGLYRSESQDPIAWDTLSIVDQFAIWAPWPRGLIYIDEIVIRY
ncbi:MAG: hypothetical protein IPK13_09510 [Deltaproteobacteria bacterium]|nr:hypothetical protein [Deltaproteobacteria bacterium]